MQAKIDLVVHAFPVPSHVALTLPPNQTPASKSPSPPVPPWAAPIAPSAPAYDGPITAPLSTLDSRTLAAMCDEFREGVFRIARKTLPEAQPHPAPVGRTGISRAITLLEVTLCGLDGSDDFSSELDNEKVNEALVILREVLATI